MPRKQRHTKGTSCALNAPLMWGYSTRLFVRHAIRRWCAFDARGFNQPPNLSITSPLCGPLLGLGELHKANYWLHSTGDPIFKRQRRIVFIGFQKPAKDKVNYTVVSSHPPGKWSWNTRPLMQAEVSKSQRQINGWNAWRGTKYFCCVQTCIYRSRIFQFENYIYKQFAGVLSEGSYFSKGSSGPLALWNVITFQLTMCLMITIKQQSKCIVLCIVKLFFFLQWL